MKRVTLLTDFGTMDGYVAAMKGAITQIAPSVLIDDASHAISPGDIIPAAFALRRYWKLYPEGTVHIVVVDPGVGSARRALAIRADDRILIGPDNGVFTFVLQDARDSEVFAIDAKPDISRTFHGRDVFAPAAGRIAAGEAVEAMGKRVEDAIRIIMPAPISTESSVRGEVVYVDRFGNLITNIPSALLQDKHTARIADRIVNVVGTYSDVESGELLALINSDGMVEVAVRDGNAAATLGVGRGESFELF